MLRMLKAEIVKVLRTPGGAYGTLLWVSLMAFDVLANLARGAGGRTRSCLSLS